MQMLHQVPRMSQIGCTVFALPAHQHYKPTQRSVACTKANTRVPKHKPEVLRKTRLQLLFELGFWLSFSQVLFSTWKFMPNKTTV